MPLFTEPTFRYGGDKALFIEVGDEITPEVNRSIRHLLNAIDTAAIPGVQALAPTYRSILVYYDPLTLQVEDLQQRLAELYGNLGDADLGASKVVEIPTLYGGDYGPDIEFVATHTNLTEAEVIEVHTSADYLVYMVGFNPGFPYLGGMSEKIATPRLPTPRVRMVPGSVGIAERQTGIYPLASPRGLAGHRKVTHKNVRPQQRSPVPGRGRRYGPLHIHRGGESTGRSRSKSRRELSKSRFGTRAEINMGVIEIIEPGLLTTVQDMGRYGYLHHGVPASGAMDPVALRMANILTGNPEDEACLEVTLAGPRLHFRSPALVAISGADLSPSLNDSPAPMWESFLARQGDVLSFGEHRSGTRAYVAVTGGFDIPVVMGSKSTFMKAAIGGFQGPSAGGRRHAFDSAPRLFR